MPAQHRLHAPIVSLNHHLEAPFQIQVRDSTAETAGLRCSCSRPLLRRQTALMEQGGGEE